MGDAASGRNRADYLGEKIRIHEGFLEVNGEEVRRNSRKRER